MVAEIIEQKKDEIAALCRMYGVRTLWVIGSATTEAFDPESSDIDVMVDLGEYDALVHRRFFGLLHALEALVERPLDLLTVRSVQSPLFRQEIEQNRVNLYEQKNDQAAA